MRILRRPDERSTSSQVAARRSRPRLAPVHIVGARIAWASSGSSAATASCSFGPVMADTLTARDQHAEATSLITVVARCGSGLNCLGFRHSVKRSGNQSTADALSTRRQPRLIWAANRASAVMIVRQAAVPGR